MAEPPIKLHGLTETKARNLLRRLPKEKAVKKLSREEIISTLVNNGINDELVRIRTSE
jgi:signal recognition particle subunit SEC65